jgi:hypothetical protein
MAINTNEADQNKNKDKITTISGATEYEINSEKEKNEINSLRFKQSYYAFLELLSDLYPNALGVKMLGVIGDNSLFDSDSQSNLDAEYLDWLLDVDHFMKGVRSDRNISPEKLLKLYQTAIGLFFDSDDAAQYLQDFGDTKVSDTNGGKVIKYNGKSYLLSDMESRYSDMKTAKDTSAEKEGKEKNYFNIPALTEINEAYTAVAKMFDFNGDNLIGTDDAVIALKFFAIDLTDAERASSIKTYTYDVSTIQSAGGFDEWPALSRDG